MSPSWFGELLRFGIDDTDSLTGGCTTALVGPILRATGLALREMPRLVRLNPNVPHKTRGNAAIVLDLVEPTGPRVQIGSWDGAAHAYPDGTEPEDVFDVVWQTVQELSRPDADPGVVCADVPETLYWQAVRSAVTPSEVRSLVEASGGRAEGGRGIVGAGAALAWPGPATSHELIAYREAAQVGTPRRVHEDGLAGLDADGTTFHSWDATEGRAACIPNTPCPVLLGLRGLDPERLMTTTRTIQAAAEEPVRGWWMFSSNQASGDHVSDIAGAQTAPMWATVGLQATVAELPYRLRGGHAGVACIDALGHGFHAMAFEPTKGMRDIVDALRPGDGIYVVGALHEDAVHMERLRIDRLATAETKVENPVCPRCRRRMKSKGRDAGYRCPEGHGTAPEGAAVRLVEQRDLRTGWYEVPVMARRHLHRPLMFDAIQET